MLEGSVLLQSIGQRIVASYLRSVGALDVALVDQRLHSGSGVVDITCRLAGAKRVIKLKTDPYFGIDPGKIADRELIFYRPEDGVYAFEAISHSDTREPGWMFHSPADDLYYYRIAIDQSEAEAAALMGEPDEVFFAELKVERDELQVLPMPPVRVWFERNHEQYTPRPVRVGDHAAWYRLIPCADLRAAVGDIRVVGPLFSPLARAV